MSQTERKTERVTVKMDANLKAKLQREAERHGGDMSSYIRSLIENRLSQAAGTCYNCIGRLEKALDAEDVGYELHACKLPPKRATRAVIPGQPRT